MFGACCYSIVPDFFKAVYDPGPILKVDGHTISNQLLIVCKYTNLDFTRIVVLDCENRIGGLGKIETLLYSFGGKQYAAKVSYLCSMLLVQLFVFLKQSAIM